MSKTISIQLLLCEIRFGEVTKFILSTHFPLITDQTSLVYHLIGKWSGN